MHQRIIAADLNTEGLTQWALTHIVPLLFLVVGIGIIASARKGRMSENAGTVANVIVGVVLIVGAALFVAFGKSLAQIAVG